MKQNSTGKTLRLYFLAVVLCCLIAAVLAPDRGAMLTGLRDILLSPAQLTRDYFFLGNISGTFLNMALVGAVCTALTCLHGAVLKGSTVAAFFLTLGFSAWGINILNLWPFLIGVALHALARRKPLAEFVDLFLFSTALCPLVSDLLLRYPGGEVHAITAAGALLALAVGMAVGFLTPAIAGHSPNLHKGYNLYSAALPGGLLGLFLVALLYKTAGYEVPPIEATLGDSHPEVVIPFCGLVFLATAALGFVLNGRSFRGYLGLLRSSGHKEDFTAKHGLCLAILNLGIYGFFILAYYCLVGASFNSVTMGIMFCMVCFGAAGSHPGNVWPILLGYFLASLLGVNAINAQAILVGACFASGLAPLTGAYGWWAGLIGGAAHYTLVTSIPALHGGFCLYNGGFTSLLITVILVPQLEMFCKTKEERRLARASRK